MTEAYIIFMLLGYCIIISTRCNAPINVKPAGGGKAGHGVGI